MRHEGGCYATELPAIETNLDAIVAASASSRPATRRSSCLLDYWSVWLGGQYAAAQGEAYVDAAAAGDRRREHRHQVDRGKTGSAYVDLRAAFKGPDYAYDETIPLDRRRPPERAGHQQIARAAQAVIESILHI